MFLKCKSTIFSFLHQENLFIFNLFLGKTTKPLFAHRVLTTWSKSAFLQSSIPLHTLFLKIFTKENKKVTKKKRNTNIFPYLCKHKLHLSKHKQHQK